MMLISFLQRLGFRSEPPPQPSVKTAPVARSPRQPGAAPALAPKTPVGKPIGGITQGFPASSASMAAPGTRPRPTPSAPRHAPSDTQRTSVVKALAKKSATNAQPVKAKTGSPAGAGEAAAAKADAERPVKTPSKPMTKASDAQPSTPCATSVSTSARLAKASGAAKPTAKVPNQVATKTSAEMLARSVPPTASKPVTKPATQTSAQAPAASKPAAVAVPKSAKQTKPAAAVSAVKPMTLAAKSAQAKAQAAQAAVEATPRPLGKRAAKKVMMEQMTQADVVPTHAPDAAKATFSTTNERVVMTPPVPSAIRKDPKRANNWKTLSVDQLTDEDIMAMPDDEYMGEFQMAYFRRKLIQLRADMLANAGETTEHLREDTVVVPDPADRATIEEEHALELRTRDRERKLLKKIEQAIGRIDSGDYGYCDETGEVIGVGRLMARPTASLSLEAQQRRELKQKMFGD
ncbi:MAG: DnaK suppressor protein [Hydrogenophaga sp.]|jgi:DnaK suppressor protein